MVGNRGFEPLASCVSCMYSTAELIARGAGRGTRTLGILLKRELHWPLCYTSIWSRIQACTYTRHGNRGTGPGSSSFMFVFLCTFKKTRKRSMCQLKLRDCGASNRNQTHFFQYITTGRSNVELYRQWRIRRGSNAHNVSVGQFSKLLRYRYSTNPFKV